MNLNLNCKGFKKYLVDTKHVFGGVQYVFRFPNNYGASVIKHDGSYGHYEDLWELAVLKFYNDEKWNLTYDTSITDDVIGYLTDEEVQNLLKQIKKLNNSEKDSA